MACTHANYLLNLVHRKHKVFTLQIICPLFEPLMHEYYFCIVACSFVQFAIMANHMPLLYQLLDNPNRLLGIDDDDKKQHLMSKKHDVITRSLHYALLLDKAEVHKEQKKCQIVNRLVVACMCLTCTRTNARQDVRATDIFPPLHHTHTHACVTLTQTRTLSRTRYSHARTTEYLSCLGRLSNCF